MARKKRKPKIKVGISIDPDLWDSVVELADLRERGGVSGVVIDCIRWALISIKQIEAPELVSELENLECQLARLKWRRQQEMLKGEYGGEYENDIALAEHEIKEEKRRIALEKEIEEHLAKQGENQKD